MRFLMVVVALGVSTPVFARTLGEVFEITAEKVFATDAEKRQSVREIEKIKREPVDPLILAVDMERRYAGDIKKSPTDFSTYTTLAENAKLLAAGLNYLRRYRFVLRREAGSFRETHKILLDQPRLVAKLSSFLAEIEARVEELAPRFARATP